MESTAMDGWARDICKDTRLTTSAEGLMYRLIAVELCAQPP